MIEAIILAGGQSRRMGLPKPLLRFGETTFLGQIIAVLHRSDVDGITVVLGSQVQRVRASVDLSGVKAVVNEHFEQGQLSSLITGLNHIAPEAEAILLCLVDHPLIATEVVNQVLAAFRETCNADVDGLSSDGGSVILSDSEGSGLRTRGRSRSQARSFTPLRCVQDDKRSGRVGPDSDKAIVIPTFDGRRGHPTLFARSVFDELRSAPVEEGARRVVRANPERVLEVETSDRGILVSIDTPEDYAQHFGTEPEVREER